jgi:hypothetical protein
VETRVTAHDQEIQKCAFCQQSDVDAVFYFNGQILESYQDHGQTVNSAQYCATLEEELKPTICSEHRGMLTNGAVLHHDNA